MFDNLIGMTVSVGNASSKRFQMETLIKSNSVWISNPNTSISPTFFLKDEGVRSQRYLSTPLQGCLTHLFRLHVASYPFVYVKCIYIRIHVFVGRLLC